MDGWMDTLFLMDGQKNYMKKIDGRVGWREKNL